MSSSGDYPLGARDDSRAPYNKSKQIEQEIEVCVSITVHKTFKLKVDDYEVLDEGKDENGNYYCDIDYTNCNLQEAFNEQYPDFDNIKDWNIDEFEIVIE